LFRHIDYVYHTELAARIEESGGLYQMRSRKADVEGLSGRLPRPGNACGLLGVGYQE